MHLLNSAQMEIRSVVFQDLETLRVFAEDQFRKSWQHMNDPDAFEAYCRHAFSMEKMKAEFDTSGSEFYLVYLEGTLTAYLKLNLQRQPADWTEGPALQLERIYVSHTIQSQGLGAALLDFTEARARATAADWVWLSVWKKSPRSVTFYERNGYEIFGVETFWLGDDPQSDWLMRKKLQPK